jgi:pimeloyl-ACP methyl ester carboxylesterase
MPNSTDKRGIEFKGVDGNRLAGDLFGHMPGAPVVLVHGGGQTRHAWHDTALELAKNGFAAITIDQRGHGDSDWIESGDYGYPAFGGDLLAVARDINRQFNQPPVLIGASLGGVAGLYAARQGGARIFGALVLVDITPNPNPRGVKRILEFMGRHLEDGFQSLEQAADAIAAYLPARKRPRDLNGLAKNLRRDDDGRYRWHWDPAFLTGRFFNAREAQDLADAARGITQPVLLVRGGASDVVGADEVRAFMELVPHARFVDVAEAGHMVAGDKNTVFSRAVIDFITALSWGL